MCVRERERGKGREREREPSSLTSGQISVAIMFCVCLWASHVFSGAPQLMTETQSCSACSG